MACRNSFVQGYLTVSKMNSCSCLPIPWFILSFPVHSHLSWTGEAVERSWGWKSSNEWVEEVRPHWKKCATTDLTFGYLLSLGLTSLFPLPPLSMYVSLSLSCVIVSLCVFVSLCLYVSISLCLYLPLLLSLCLLCVCVLSSQSLWSWSETHWSTCAFGHDF